MKIAMEYGTCCDKKVVVLARENDERGTASSCRTMPRNLACQYHRRFCADMASGGGGEARNTHLGKTKKNVHLMECEAIISTRTIREPQALTSTRNGGTYTSALR